MLNSTLKVSVWFLAHICFSVPCHLCIAHSTRGSVVLLLWHPLSCCLLNSPLLFPPAAQESDRGSGLELAHTLALLARGGYLEAPRSLLLRLLAASPPLSLAAPANWNLISWAPALVCFCQLDQQIALLGRTGWMLRIPQELYTGFVLRFLFRSQACCFAQSHCVNCWWNKYVKLGVFSCAVRVSHLSLVGGVKRP